MDEQDLIYIKNLERAKAEADLKVFDNTRMQSSMYESERNLNLIQWQLELDNILERIDHLLRGHELKFDERGNLMWKETNNKSNVVFNEYGVQEILRILSMYLNRNTILSNYDEKIINLKLYDFGIEITDLLFMKYDTMFDIPSFEVIFDSHIKNYEHDKLVLVHGKILVECPQANGQILFLELNKEQIDKLYEIKATETLIRIKLYPIVVRELIDVVHSAYLRALGGGERDSLRTARTVNQSQPLGSNMQVGGSMSGLPQSKFSLIHPTTWARN